ncbi:hypothetical protein ACELLULO517_15525 [Acidisoma cellulosilytica]|uniref:Membrane-anchored protein n=1 Tax=Acidisoma cellulosilyticum TaxID=2802395 RepID=A0A963Z2R4_9PROT|nr:hypothetical protein [Acidisoma cellulosilyticum]MCB8881659.1 hypothetical protein [Acidisoma cellulosilyticum]
MSSLVTTLEERPRVIGASKVPLTTLNFWTVKILSTAMGEAASDYLVKHMDPILAVGLGATGFVIALLIQFSTTRYNSWSYWFLVSMIAIFGTMFADALHLFGLPLTISTVVFASLLAVIFFAWYRVEGTLSVHSIDASRREVFYWVTVMTSFTLGTAAGDWTAVTLHLGNLLSGFVFLGLFLLPGLGFWKFGLNPIVAFWFSYVMTRPLGASFADWIGKPTGFGGLGFGTGHLSLLLTACIVLLVFYLSVTRRDVDRVTAPAE